MVRVPNVKIIECLEYNEQLNILRQSKVISSMVYLSNLLVFKLFTKMSSSFLQANCESMGGHLADIKTQEEQLFVENLIDAPEYQSKTVNILNVVIAENIYQRII